MPCPLIVIVRVIILSGMFNFMVPLIKLHDIFVSFCYTDIINFTLFVFPF